MGRITVALVGDPEKAFTSAAVDWEGLRDFRIPWSERPKVELAGDDDLTLDGILAAAAHRFGLTLPDDGGPTFGFWAFYSEHHEAQFSGLRRDVTLADAEGHAVWSMRDWRDTTLRELLYAAERGVFVGDPTRIYLVPLRPAGDGVFLGWSQLLEALRIAYNVAEIVGTAAGAVLVGQHVLERVRSRLRGGREAIGNEYSAWSERGATPDRLDRFLRDRVWHSADLARVLGCAEELAVAILGAWGFAQAASGVWRLEDDEPARLIRKLHEEIVTAAALPSTDPFEQVYRHRIEPLVSTGERAPLPEPEPEDDDELEGFETELFEGQALDCQCGDPSCTARVYMFRSWPGGEHASLLRLRFENYVDHFDFRTPGLGAILGHMADL